MDAVSELLNRAGFLIWPWLFAFGACTGSFLNVVVYRLPRGQSLSYPGSRCPVCGHPIRWYHNLPIFSWFWLRGKCYDCAAPIAFRYPLVELANAMLFVVVAVLELRPTAVAEPSFGPALSGGQLLVRYGYHLWLLDTLLAAALIERDGQRIPRRLTALAIAVGLIGALVCPAVQPHFAQVVPAAWLLDSHLTAFTEAVVGSLIGLLAGWVYGLAARERIAPETLQPGGLASEAKRRGGPTKRGAASVGAFFGWQAPVLAGLVATVAWLAVGRLNRQHTEHQTIERQLDSSPAVQARWGWNTMLLLTSLGWLIAARLWLDHLPVWLP
jgi:prepilin signal peptidase PulO-like enzyme (type II secretory pathway)